MSNNLKILIDCHVFNGSYQGTTTYIKGLYLELIKDKTKEFYFVADDTRIIEQIFGSRRNVHYLKFSSKNKLFRLLFELPRIIKKNKIDFAHFQYIVPPIKNCRYIVTTHDVLFIDYPDYFPVLNRLKNEFLFKWSAKRSDIVLTVSEYSRKQIHKHFKIDKIYITTNAVSEEFFENYDKISVQKEVEEKFNISNYIIYVSRWEPRKKHDLVLKGFVNLKLYKNHKLLFIGDTSFENQEYNAYYNALGQEIKNQIHSLKRVDFNSMLKLLRGAKVSVYPSVAEGFGISPLESLAAKIPTITSNKTAMSDFDFLSDYSFDPLNEKEFEEKLTKALVMSDSEIIPIIELMKKKYSWKNAAIVYNDALSDS